ncbi:DgyrCDS454 [Dimorphilus gyrociliatus]|uniref:DgyrCDS454 n=1 Tax=Dimorphilus gyrociliatus TaxID=2664684 RepID=A0A7I8V667_9ANNE|nr:DgyrCDS454 [Dimorphilus gyrociliatus]
MNGGNRSYRISRMSLGTQTILAAREKTSYFSSTAEESKPLELYILKSDSNSRIVWLYVVANKIPFELYNFDRKISDLRCMESFNPTLTLPCIVDGSKIIFGTEAILNYLAEKYASFRLLGDGDPDIKAECNGFISLAVSVIYRIVQKEYVEPQLDDKCDIYLRKHLTNRAKIEVEHRLNQLEKLLRANNFLMGNKGL